MNVILSKQKMVTVDVSSNDAFVDAMIDAEKSLNASALALGQMYRFDKCKILPSDDKESKHSHEKLLALQSACQEYSSFLVEKIEQFRD
jgi:hypothetical protein